MSAVKVPPKVCPCFNVTTPLAGADIIKLSKSIDTTGTSVLPP